MPRLAGNVYPAVIGLGQLNRLIKDGAGRQRNNGDTLDAMEETALSVMESADCAIGYEAAQYGL